MIIGQASLYREPPFPGARCCAKYFICVFLWDKWKWDSGICALEPGRPELLSQICHNELGDLAFSAPVSHLQNGAALSHLPFWEVMRIKFT